MMFDPGAFAIGTLIARKEKVTGAGATQAGLLMGIGGMSPTGVLLMQSSIRSARRRQRDAAAAGTGGGDGVSLPPPTPPPTPTASGTPSWPAPTPVAGVTAEELKTALDSSIGQLGKQMEAQNAKLLDAIQALAATVAAQGAGIKKSNA
ncbi:MAG: hypothetical protein JWM65_1400 [Sphingomonas bacterium]|nr:hypothetical protein [Sphingomonas bacterium]